MTFSKIYVKRTREKYHLNSGNCVNGPVPTMLVVAVEKNPPSDEECAMSHAIDHHGNWETASKTPKRMMFELEVYIHKWYYGIRRRFVIESMHSRPPNSVISSSICLCVPLQVCALDNYRSLPCEDGSSQ
mmetsp:Transcript_15086/g.22594  ORF Transcript_15086/g.22594 Transcript_15086/m.22594 type:complete len:130 (-) Transcript_15086:1236-1625(-)